MKIVKLEAENIKRLSAVEITPDGSLVVIGGKNAAGKTSVLDSIMYALDGKASIPSRPLRDGEKHGHVTCELEDLVVKRTFTESGGGQLIVANKEGARYQSPQTILDKLTGRLTFDPLAFARLDRRQQLATLRELVGVDLSDLDAQRGETYGKRGAVNRSISELAARLKAMPDHPNAPTEEVSVSKLVAELEAGQDALRSLQAKEEQRKVAEHTLRHQQERLAHAEEDLRTAEQSVELARGGIAKAEEILDRITAVEAEAAKTLPDLQPIRDQLASAEEVNRQVRQNAARAQVATELISMRESSDHLTETLRGIEQEKADRITAAEFPIEGLGFDEDGVTFGGLPFDQASSAEQLRVSVAMGLALNPKLRVLLIRDGSLLDEESLRLVAEMADAADAQVWLERVGDGKECSVIIEDGAVRGDTTR